jgi:hypothetical protein
MDQRSNPSVHSTPARTSNSRHNNSMSNSNTHNNNQNTALTSEKQFPSSTQAKPNSDGGDKQHSNNRVANLALATQLSKPKSSSSYSARSVKSDYDDDGNDDDDIFSQQSVTLQNTLKTEQEHMRSINLPSHVSSQLRRLPTEVHTINNQEANLEQVQGVSIWSILAEACFHISPKFLR